MKTADENIPKLLQKIQVGYDIESFDKTFFTYTFAFDVPMCKIMYR